MQNGSFASETGEQYGHMPPDLPDLLNRMT